MPEGSPILQRAVRALSLPPEGSGDGEAESLALLRMLPRRRREPQAEWTGFGSGRFTTAPRTTWKSSLGAPMRRPCSRIASGSWAS